MMTLGKSEIILKTDEKTAKNNKLYGFHLLKSKWDPYPWIGSVEPGSLAYISGLRSGDCLLDVNGKDIAGLCMKDIANLIKKKVEVKLGIWHPHDEGESNKLESPTHNYDYPEDKSEILLEGPLPEVAQKLINSISGIINILECPICFMSAGPPISQCVNGHILCQKCRIKSLLCPVCRVRLGRGRCLLAEQCYEIMYENLVKKTDSGKNLINLQKGIFGVIKEDNTYHKSMQRSNLLTKVLKSNWLTVRNASTESLPTSSNFKASKNHLKVLQLFDRVKSASTGELSKEQQSPVNRSIQNLDFSYYTKTSNPNSVESLNISEKVKCILCPFYKRDNCNKMIPLDVLMEHFSMEHLGPVINYYKNSITIPIPIPFSDNGIHIIHFNKELFFIQHENQAIWISTTAQNYSKWIWKIEFKNKFCFKKRVQSCQNFSCNEIVKYDGELTNSLVTITLDEQHIKKEIIEV